MKNNGLNSKQTNTKPFNTDEIREKIIKGLELTFQKLLKEKQKEDSEFVFSKKGKIVKIKARDFVYNK